MTISTQVTHEQEAYWAIFDILTISLQQLLFQVSGYNVTILAYDAEGNAVDVTMNVLGGATSVSGDTATGSGSHDVLFFTSAKY